MSRDAHAVKLREEQKRSAALGAAGRWQLIMRAISWAETQAHVQRNTPAKCLQLERIQLARLGTHDLAATQPAAKHPPCE